MAEGYQVRPPVSAELPLAQALRHEILDPARKVEIDATLTAADFDPRHIHMAAFLGERMVSTVRLDPLPDGTYEVRKMATAIAHRRRGLGGRVLRAAEREAIEHGALGFRLDARKNTLDFYKEHGYQLTGEEVMHTDGVPNFVMVKSADPPGTRAVQVLKYS